MIDYAGSENERVQIPSVPDDVIFFGENAGSLAKIANLLHQILLGQKRAESPNPQLITLANGRDVGFVAQMSTVRLRGQWLIIGNVSIGTIPFGLQIGSAVIPLMALGNGVTTYIPFPVVIDTGIQITLWNMATNVAADTSKCVAVIFGYPEIQTVTP